jgi:two-component system nitrate/nitrite response regulator NarL
MSSLVEGGPDSPAIPPRILVAGSDLLAGALASALETHGLATMHIAPTRPEIELGIQWRPDLILFDVQTIDLETGSELVGHFCRKGAQVCVIDTAYDNTRKDAWQRLGASEIVDGTEPFDQLFRTITRLLRFGHPRRNDGESPTPLASTPTNPSRRDSHLQTFASLTDREKVVLAELLEGHCAEEIAEAAFVSISTIRSQIKSILQKLGVNSQLAAVALARRSGWPLEHPEETRPKPGNARRSRAS